MFSLLVYSYFAASILNIVYGIKVDEKTNTEFVHCGEMAMQGAAIAGVPGAFLVDILPVCEWSLPYDGLSNGLTDYPIVKYVPAWFPAAGFKNIASYYRHYILKLADAPAEFAKKEMVRWIHLGSFSTPNVRRH